MAVIVQKYGGSSVANADKIKHVANRIAAAKRKGNAVAVTVSAMGDTTDDLIKLASGVTTKPDPREMDLLLSTGEQVSCALVAMALRELGHDAVSMTGFQAGITTDTTFGKARILKIDPKRVKEALDQGKIVIVCGFQGYTPEMEITTLGRGSSDLTAVALAAVLGAKQCEIYTDVEGIYTADPRVVPDARKLKEISYEEMLELASYGAKMQARSIELGAAYDVPIYVASTFVEAPGTLIHRNAKTEGSMEGRKKVTGVTYDLNVARITLVGVPDKPGIAATLFEPLSNVAISVDTIVQNVGDHQATDLSFTVARTDLQRALDIIKPVAQNLKARDVRTDPALAKVSIVGAGMQNSPGYASRMFRTLADSGINIEMITTSEIRITCLVRDAQAKDAVKVLHKAFEMDKE